MWISLQFQSRLIYISQTFAEPYIIIQPETMSEKNYFEFIKDLQNKYSSKNLNLEEESKKLFTDFTAKIKSVFKINVTFDGVIVKSLIRRLKQQFGHFYYEQSFTKTLNFIEKFSQILKKEKFIGKRHEKQLMDRINNYKKDPCFNFFNKVCYLRTAADKNDFRQDFMWKFMNITDDEEIQDFEDQDYMKNYNMFWKHLFSLNPDKKLIVYIYSCFSKFEDPHQMLNSDVREEINKHIGQDVGKTQIEVQLNHELKALAVQNFYENSPQAKQRVNKQYEIIENLLHRFSGTKKIIELNLQLKTSKFGSLISGFAGADSDLDITILTNTYVNQNNFLMFLLEFLRIEFFQQDKKTGRVTKVQKIDASTPLIQVQISQNRRGDKFKVDILVNNTLGVINSKLLSVYSQIPWIKQLGILFKLWAKTNGLIDQQLLSSYAIINMLIYFLLKKNYVNWMYSARNRTKQTANFLFKRIKNGQVQSFEVFYEFKNNVQEVTSLKNVNLAQVLKELFHFYSQSGQHWSKNEGKNIISIDGTYEKQFDEQCTFTIKDPFDQPHNPGRAKAINKTFFLDHFKSAYNGFVELTKKTKKQERSSLISSIFQKN